MFTNTSTNVNLPRSPISTPSDGEVYDVVVMGAGLVDLVTAIGLRQHGKELTMQPLQRFD